MSYLIVINPPPFPLPSRHFFGIQEGVGPPLPPSDSFSGQIRQSPLSCQFSNGLEQTQGYKFAPVSFMRQLVTRAGGARYCQQLTNKRQKRRSTYLSFLWDSGFWKHYHLTNTVAVKLSNLSRYKAVQTYLPRNGFH